MSRPQFAPRSGGARPGLALAVLAAAALLLLPGPARGQTSFPSGGGNLFPGTLFGTSPDLFPQDGRIRVLVLGLNTFGLTETAAEQIGLILQKDLNNTGHFAVVGPREMNAAFERENPGLVDCRGIACGVEAGKRLGADRVLVGTIRMEEDTFVLEARLINTFTNVADYQEEVRFTDESMDETLFRLANNISRNALRIGPVLSSSVRGIVVGLGKRHGLKIGDFLTVYKQEGQVTNLQGEPIDQARKNVAIAKVLNVNENSAEATVVHKIEEPQAGYFAQTYLDRVRQIEMVENTRRELDTSVRLTQKVRPLELAPVLLADSERKEWEQRMQQAQSGLFRWRTITVVAGVVTLYFMNDYEDTDLSRMRLLAAAGVTGYSAWRWMELRGEIDDLRVEGRAKGYVSGMQWSVLPTGDGLALNLRLKF